MIETIKFNTQIYPFFQSQGNAAQFAMPYAQQVCKGYGVDIGCHKKEWAFSNADTEVEIVDPIINNFDALHFPYDSLDFIFSSHCLEHIESWVDAMEYWSKKIKKGGVLFLYLPDYSQEYWRPWNNHKHKHILTREVIYDNMIHNKYINIFSSGVDLNNSFMIMGEKS